jgi:large repetitive protein
VTVSPRRRAVLLVGLVAGIVAGVAAGVSPAQAADPATLTLVSTVTNDDGGTSTSADWALTATDGTTTVGPGAGIIGAVVPAGTYSLSVAPDPLPGYVWAWSCTGPMVTATLVELSSGADVTCILALDDRPATLTLDAVVVGGDGSVSPTEWVLSATSATTAISGASGAAAVTGATVPGGGYTLASAGPSGYLASWDCDSGAPAGDVVTVVVGTTVTCTAAFEPVAASTDPRTTDAVVPLIATPAPGETGAQLAATGGTMPLAAFWIGGAGVVAGVVVAIAAVRRRPRREDAADPAGIR